jgi:hypothetical protein
MSSPYLGAGDALGYGEAAKGVGCPTILAGGGGGGQRHWGLVLGLLLLLCFKCDQGSACDTTYQQCSCEKAEDTAKILQAVASTRANPTTLHVYYVAVLVSGVRPRGILHAVLVLPCGRRWFSGTHHLRTVFQV